MSSDAARFIKHELPDTVDSAVRDAERIVNRMSSQDNSSQTEQNKRKIMESLNEAQEKVNASFDKAKDKVVDSMPRLSEEQQEELIECTSRLGKFVEGVTRLIEDVINKVIAFFERVIEKIQETLNDFKQTISNCCSAIRRFASRFFG